MRPGRWREAVRRWGVLAVIAMLVATVGVPLFARWQRGEAAFVRSALVDLRAARVDLVRGYMHVRLGREPGAPYDVEQGIVLLDQATRTLERVVDEADREVVGDAAVVRQHIDRFQEVFAGASAGTPLDEVRLRTALYEVERDAEHYDASLRRRLDTLLARGASAFDFVAATSAILFLACVLGLFFAARAFARSADETSEREIRLRQLAENIDEAVWLATRYDVLLYISPSAEAIWSRDRFTQGTPLRWLDVIHPEDRDKVVAAEARDGSCDVTCRIETPRGERLVRIRSFPVLDAKGEATRVVGVADDVTERRSLEQRLEESAKLEALGRLAGGVAHDFNNLLTVILGNASLLELVDDAPEEVGRLATEVREAAHRASQLTRQLLAYSRKQPMLRRPIDLHDTIESTAQLVRRLLGADVELVLTLDRGDATLVGEASQLGDMLMNLAVNSRDAMPEGGRLTFATRLEPDTIELVVSDTGSGIPKEVRPHIFEPFFTTKALGRGTGLGLAMVHGIVQQHGGTITLDAASTGGATFRIRLPRVADAPVPNSEAPPRRTERRALRVLVVDDERGVRDVVARTLRAEGHTVLEASSGDEALVLADTELSTLDLLLSDLVMPGMSGQALAAELRARRSTLSVLFMSGYSPATELPHEVLLKPFASERLLAAVEDATSHD